jgi:hypothetical protein
VDVARSLVIGASSMASTVAAGSSASTVRKFNPFRDTLPDYIHDDRDESAPSVRGVPLSTQKRLDLDSWVQAASGAPSEVSNFDNGFPLSSAGSPSIAGASQWLNTPPSTIASQAEADVEVELMRRRIMKARDLMAREKFKEALPHLEKTLKETSEESEMSSRWAFEDAPSREEIQLLLATALTMDDPACNRAEPILREVFSSPNSKPLDRLSAAHLLAKLWAELQRKDLLRSEEPDPFSQGQSDLTEAKSMCLVAVKGRLPVLGRTDPKTYESIALLADICEASYDSDAELWRDMLPENYAQQQVQTDVSTILPSGPVKGKPRILDNVKVPPLSPDRIVTYTRLFTSVAEDMGVMTGARVRSRISKIQANFVIGDQGVQLFKKSGLPEESLGHLWALVDVDNKGFLARDEFVIMIHLIQSFKNGTMEAFPSSTHPWSTLMSAEIKRTDKPTCAQQ